MKPTFTWLQLLLLFFVSAAEAQNTLPIPSEPALVAGKITDAATGEPIQGAKVFFPPGRKGALADEKGEYLIHLGEAGDVVVLAVTADGFQSQWFEEIILTGGANQLDVALERIEKKSFTLEHRTPNDILPDIKELAKDGLTVSEKLGTITVENTKNVISKVASVIALLDVPPANIWLEVAIIRASEKGGGMKPFPPEIESVVKKLTTLFRFKQYELVGRAHAIGSENSDLQFSSGTGDPKLGALYVETRLYYSNEIIKLRNIGIRFENAAGAQIQTTINVKNGETVILGVSQRSVPESAIITVVTAKVVE